jgi:two-component system sensor histidine kinase AtoS
MLAFFKKVTRVRLGIAIQVFTTLLILVLGLLVIEANLGELIATRKPISPFQLRTALLNIRAEVLLIALLAFVCGLVLTFTIRREVKRAADGVGRISRGDFDPDIPTDLTDEFVPLSTAIRDLGEALNRFLQQSLTDAIIMVNDDLSVDVLNPTAEVLTGYASEEVRGKPLGLLFPEGRSNEELYGWLRDERGLHQADGPQTGVLLTQNRDWVHVRLGTFQVHRDGRRLRGIVAGAFDMEEWGRIREEFDRAKRFSTLGLLVGGLAHEIKNPLGSIHGLVQMLAEEIPEIHPKRRYYDTILEEVNRVDRIMKRLLDLSSPSRWRFQRMALGGIVEEVAMLMRSEAERRDVILRGEVLEKEIPVVGDADRIKQAVLNVLKNAIEATSQGEVVAWTLEADGPWAVYSVQNPGEAIPDSIASRIPLSFVSGKPEGSGLGLAITNQILHQHGGYLRVQNLEEGGVVVRLFFPIDTQGEKRVTEDMTSGPQETSGASKTTENEE